MRLTAEQYNSQTDHERRMYILGATVQMRLDRVENTYAQEFLTDPNYLAASKIARDHRYTT